MLVGELMWGADVVHIKSNKQYKIINLIKVEHPETKEWFDAVIYTDKLGVVWYSRSYENFCNSFNLLKNG